MKGMTKSTRAFLNAFLACALALAVLSAILAGAAGDGSKVIASSFMAVLVVAVLVSINRSKRS